MGEPSRRNGLLTPGVPMWARLRAIDLWPVLAALCGVLRCAGNGVAPARMTNAQELTQLIKVMAP